MNNPYKVTLYCLDSEQAEQAEQAELRLKV
jgi:hypothetical protein